jgi:bifunctional non-homologous end joining protein LigD
MTGNRDARKAGPARESIEVAGVRLSHPDKVLYADQALTKQDLAEHYLLVADHMLPHIVGRPLSLVRCPAGEGEHCFFQKHAGTGVPEAVRRILVDEKDGPAEYLAIDGLAGLLSLVQIGVLAVHPWGSRVDAPERPDRLILDFDPGEGVPWEQVVEAAREVRQRLSDLGLASFLKATGGKGLHVVVPISRRLGWDEAKSFTKAVAEAMAHDSPERYVTTVARKARQGRILIDFLRNTRGATAIAPYSTRARPGATVALPLCWEDLDTLAGPDRFTVANLQEYLGARRDDPWAEMARLRQSITAKARRGVGMSR